MPLRTKFLTALTLSGLIFAGPVVAQTIQLDRPVVSAEAASERLHSLTAMMAAMHKHYLGIAKRANPSLFDEPKRKTPEAQRAFESDANYFIAAHSAALTFGNLVGSIEHYQKHNGTFSRFLVNQDDRRDSQVVFQDPRRIAACNAEIIRASEAFEQAHARQMTDAPNSELVLNYQTLRKTLLEAAERAKNAPGRLAFDPTEEDRETLRVAASATMGGWQQDHTIIRYTLSKPVRLFHLYGPYAVTHGIPEFSTHYRDDTRDLTEYLAASCISPMTAMKRRDEQQQELRVMHQEIAKVFKP